MDTSKTAILWFRNDLRLKDNPALIAACKHGSVLPIYIWDPETEKPWQAGGASQWWLHHSLKALDESLRHHGSRLFLFKGDRFQVLKDLVAQESIGAIYWNRAYEPKVRQSDKEIYYHFKDSDVHVAVSRGNLIAEPGEILKSDGSPYLVYTAFWNCFLKNPRATLSEHRIQIPKVQITSKGEGLKVDELELLPKIPWDRKFYDRWQPGEESALKRLEDFLKSCILHYQTQRNLPFEEGTSMLSPHLHFGEIHPLRILESIESRFKSLRKLHDLNLIQYCKEILWREFSHHLLYQFPSLPEESMRKTFQHFPWKRKSTGLEAWKRGQTGYPIVDAGMRQLWAIGWMHNRVRMVVASFLTKDLNIAWQDGARWFWDTLVDADLANNTQGWQWTAGCGVDAAPFFRIFNPITQGEKFDPHGDYVKTWCPELKNLPAKWVHKPWMAPEKVLDQADVRLGKNYPHPILDHNTARKEALEKFKKLE